jgi:MFS family permease
VWTAIALGLDSTPQLLAGPVGGVLVDAWDRRKLLIFLPMYQATLSIGFGIVVLLGLVGPWHVIVFVVLMGFSWSLIEPSRMALNPLIVPRRNLINAYSLTQLAFSVTRLVGPAIGGVLLAVFGAGPTLLLEGGFQLSASFMAFLIGAQAQPKASVNLRSVWAGLGRVAAYARTTPLISGLLLCGIVSPLLVVPFTSSLMPVYQAEEFKVGQKELGWLLAAIGAGSTMGGVLMASFAHVKRQGRLLFLVIFAAALSMAAVSHIPYYWAALPVFVIVGACFTLTQTLSSALIQGNVRDDLRGGVSGVLIATWGFLIIGSVLSGLLARSLGAPNSTLIASVLLFVFVVVIAVRFRAVRELP